MYVECSSFCRIKAYNNDILIFNKNYLMENNIFELDIVLESQM